MTQPYIYTGREYDPETNLYYRARYYDPSIGRFLQTDPIGYIGGINLYTYVGNNPVNWVDPWGFFDPSQLGISPFVLPMPNIGIDPENVELTGSASLEFEDLPVSVTVDDQGNVSITGEYKKSVTPGVNLKIKGGIKIKPPKPDKPDSLPPPPDDEVPPKK